ncbi:5-deoxy-glucuronate isomerase [Saccharibacillus kuerlensis]|uniref:5-deoxy-glucuronate isomerase n=1 Tax=Saccharibacillus kuerlensis TaxID=459527 RepID=A0ABQ2L502_9BACL|nr:5-deoxy-glucuronate isomerase [Saccharibacillus kuerlensis]GGO03246.1 5-deoxy-glucuronate isomerase [Saccharibacillus kuerlensis]
MVSHLQRKPLNEQRGEAKIVQEILKRDSRLQYVEFRLIELEPEASYEETLEGDECCIVALTGSITVTEGEHSFEGIGTRESVFERVPTDSVFVSGGKSFRIEGVTKARAALCYSPSLTSLPTKLIKAEEVGTEQRGKYQNRRTVHNILPDSDPTASSLLVVEVYTEGGNFSSYPPHKHDQDNMPHESFLEETYYHEIDPQQGFLFQRVYTDDRSLDETMAVEHGDVVIVPVGYHPVGVPDGYTSYYLNVMAGPTRVWKFHNDPDHEWILDRQ